MITPASQLPAGYSVNPDLNVERDRWGRPLIQTPDGKIKPYTRASTLGKALEDGTGLTKWLQRMAVIGVCSRRDLVLAVNAHRADKNKISALVEQGMDAAESKAAATTGTALHEICDQVDHGKDPYVPEEFVNDIAAYVSATEQLEVVVAEEFCVCDELQVGGTPDRVYRLKVPLRVNGEELLPAGALVIGDIKTGSSLNYGHIGYSVQMACYAHAQRYDLSQGLYAPYRGSEVPVGVRSDWVPGEQVSTQWGLIIHLPSGQGTASVHPVDLAVGWQLAGLSADVRQWRRRKDIIGEAVELNPYAQLEEWAARCDAVQTLDELYDLHLAANRAGVWSDVLKQRFTRRRLQLEFDSGDAA